MKSYFLNKNIMAVNSQNNNIDTTVNEQFQTPETNSEKKGFKKQLTTLMTSVALSTSLILITPTNAQTIQQATTSVVDGGIDNSQKLSRINQEISDIENQIRIIEEKNELQDKDFDELNKLQNKRDDLDKERDTIKDKNDNQLDETIAIKDNEGKILDIENNKDKKTIKQLDEIRVLLSNK